jgi:hypothetical protein
LGTLEFKPSGCEASGRCELVYDFGFIDPSRVGWQAKAGLISDGASIPGWAQPVIGGAWEKEFIQAAVIHDWYCIRAVRTRSATHRMFYDALIESGVPRPKASIMYYAVLVGSHMWINLIEGQPCSGMDNCVQGAGVPLRIPGAIVRKNENDELVAYREPRFGDPDVAKDLIEAGDFIGSGSFDSPERIEALARARHPEDLFLRNGDSIAFEGPSSRHPQR